jgi:hypothetical protein
MNTLRTFTICLALLISHLATADIKTIALASEVSLSEFRVPASVNGVASFKTCESCELQVVSVTSNTRYEINHRTVKLQEFRKSLSTVSNRDRKTVIVMHHLESDVITSISINL